MRRAIPSAAVAIVAALTATLLSTGAPGAHAARTADPPRLQTLTPVSQVAYFPRLALNERGTFTAAWFRGAVPAPAPTKTPAPGAKGRPAVARLHSDDVVVATGSVNRGFDRPVLLGRSGSPSESRLHVAVAATGQAFVAWLPAGSSGRWVVAVGHAETFASPVTINLPVGGSVLSLNNGRAGSDVDIEWVTSSQDGRRVRRFCSELLPNGQLSDTQNPIRTARCESLPLGSASTLGLRPQAPEGYDVARRSVTERANKQGAVAVWDSARRNAWPPRGVIGGTASNPNATNHDSRPRERGRHGIGRP